MRIWAGNIKLSSLLAVWPWNGRKSIFAAYEPLWPTVQCAKKNEDITQRINTHSKQNSLTKSCISAFVSQGKLPPWNLIAPNKFPFATPTWIPFFKKNLLCEITISRSSRRQQVGSANDFFVYSALHKIPASWHMGGKQFLKKFFWKVFLKRRYLEKYCIFITDQNRIFFLSVNWRRLPFKNLTSETWRCFPRSLSSSFLIAGRDFWWNVTNNGMMIGWREKHHFPALNKLICIISMICCSVKERLNLNLNLLAISQT